MYVAVDKGEFGNEIRNHKWAGWSAAYALGTAELGCHRSNANRPNNIGIRAAGLMVSRKN